MEKKRTRAASLVPHTLTTNHEINVANKFSANEFELHIYYTHMCACYAVQMEISFADVIIV